VCDSRKCETAQWKKRFGHASRSLNLQGSTKVAKPYFAEYFVVVLMPFQESELLLHRPGGKRTKIEPTRVLLRLPVVSSPGAPPLGFGAARPFTGGVQLELHQSSNDSASFSGV